MSYYAGKPILLGEISHRCTLRAHVRAVYVIICVRGRDAAASTGYKFGPLSIYVYIYVGAAVKLARYIRFFLSRDGADMQHTRGVKT